MRAPLLIIRKLSSPTLHPEFPCTTRGTNQFVIQDSKHIKGRHGEREAVLLLGAPACSWRRRTAAAVVPCTPPPSTTDVSWDSCVEFLCRPFPQRGPSHDRSAGPAPQAEVILTDGSLFFSRHLRTGDNDAATQRYLAGMKNTGSLRGP